MKTDLKLKAIKQLAKELQDTLKNGIMTLDIRKSEIDRFTESVKSILRHYKYSIKCVFNIYGDAVISVNYVVDDEPICVMIVIDGAKVTIV